jgi:hypothetical protein
LLVSAVVLLAASTGCSRQGAIAGAVVAYEVAEGLESTDNPEREWTTADESSEEDDAEVSTAGMARPVPPHMPASAADRRVEPQHMGFDLGRAYGSLAKVDLDACRAQGLISGYGRVTVAFEPAGTPVGVNLELPTGSAPAARACVEQAFRSVRVAPFEGAPVNVRRAFFVKP